MLEASYHCYPTQGLQLYTFHIHRFTSDSALCMQSNKGAKNHAVILPDAYKEAATSALAGAAFGAAGQRCMAVSAAVFVGGIEPWKESLLEKAKKLTVGAGHVKGVDVGPMITPEAKQRAIDLITQAEKDVSSCL